MKKALVIDDDPFFREMLERLLSGEFEVRVAADGNAGLAACRAAGADVVLLDVFMPGRGGLAVVEGLADDARTAGLPVVALTAGQIDAPLRAAFGRHPSVRCLLDKVAPPRRLLEAARRAAED